MADISATAARACIYELLDEAANTHQPIRITGKRSNGVLVGEQDWLQIQETLFLLSTPGMRESIRRGLKTPAEECRAQLDW